MSLTGEVTVPSLGIVEFDDGRIQWPAKPSDDDSVKEMNYRIKGTEMFWNNPVGAEAILQIRSA